MLFWILIIVLLFGVGGGRWSGYYSGPPFDVGLLVLVVILFLLFRGRF